MDLHPCMQAWSTQFTGFAFVTTDRPCGFKLLAWCMRANDLATLGVDVGLAEWVLSMHVRG